MFANTSPFIIYIHMLRTQLHNLWFLLVQIIYTKYRTKFINAILPCTLSCSLLCSLHRFHISAKKTAVLATVTYLVGRSWALVYFVICFEITACLRSQNKDNVLFNLVLFSYIIWWYGHLSKKKQPLQCLRNEN